jgi:hypothetical protein
MTLSENLSRIQERIAAAASKSGRSPGDVTLVAVSKTRTAKEVEAAIRAGVSVLGENRVQEAEGKRASVSLPAQWHLVGHLQRNKVGTALGLFDLIHSVDSVRLAREIGKQAGEGKVVRALVQVNVSGEVSKFGFSPDETPDRVAEIGSVEGLEVEGLMTIGAHESDPEKVRPGFEKLRAISERVSAVRQDGVRMKHLSMGMSGDFEVAIEAGATLVRVGTALFGARE